MLTATALDQEPGTVVPAFVSRVPRGPYRSLNPLTKLVIGLAEVVVAFMAGHWTGPVSVLAVVLGVAAVARVWRMLALVASLTLPVVGSILLINTFLFPGAQDPIIRIGPLAPTWSGLSFGVQVAIRLLAISLALALVYLTTPPDDLLSDLERRHVGRRLVFIVGSAVNTVPRMVERAAEIVDAQRARGLDTEGAFWRRARGVLPLAAPVILGSLTEVEEQTMALEARAFSAPGRRTPVRALPDSTVQRLARWLIVAAAAALAGASVTGSLTLP